MSELVFNVTQEHDGGYVALAIGESITPQGDTWDEALLHGARRGQGMLFRLAAAEMDSALSTR